MTQNVEVELSLPGLKCPMPVLRAKKALAGMASGTILKVISTDPASQPDLSAFCFQTGHHLLQTTTEENDGVIEFVTLIAAK